MDANQVAAISAVAGLFTGIATLFTIIELRAQRRVQHRPELVVEDVHFRALRLNGDHVPPVIEVVPAELSVAAKGVRTVRLPIVLRNVGRGSARDVAAIWSFDAQQFAAVLAPYDSLIGGRIWVDGKSVQLEHEGTTRWFTTGVNDSRVGTILPDPTSQEKTISVDFGYGLMLAAYFGAASTLAGSDVLHTPLPDLFLNLSYRDIEGVQYSKSLRFQFQLVVVVPSGWEEDGEHAEIAQGYFRVDDV